jgi:F0F1-type ATP synthase membrane subunit b/b'
MFYLTILLTFIQFFILFYLYFKVKRLDKMMDRQQIESNEIIVSIKRLHEKIDKWEQ